MHSHCLGLCTGGLGHVCGMYKAASTKILRILIPAIYKEAAMTLNIVRGPHSYLNSMLWPQVSDSLQDTSHQRTDDMKRLVEVEGKAVLDFGVLSVDGNQ